MEMCNVIEDGLKSARDTARAAAQATERGDIMMATHLTGIANGLMLSVLCHALFGHSYKKDDDLWTGLFSNTQMGPRGNE